MLTYENGSKITLSFVNIVRKSFMYLRKQYYVFDVQIIVWRTLNLT